MKKLILSLFICIFLINCVSAMVTMTEKHEIPLTNLSTGGSYAQASGMYISVKDYPIKLYSVSFNDTGISTYPNSIVVLAQNSSLIMSRTLNNNNTVDFGGLILSANTYYYIAVNNGGSLYDTNNNMSGTTILPINGDKIIWQGSRNKQGADVYDQAWSIQNITITYLDFIENYRNYTSPILSGQINQIGINLTYNNSQFSGINVILNYNSTNYTMSTSDSGNTKLFNYNLTIPSVLVQTNKTFNFIILLSNSTGTYEYQTSSSNQTINPFLIDNCTGYTKEILSLLMKDEQTLTDMDGTIEIGINFYTFGTTNLVSVYNGSLNHTAGIPSKICVQNLSTDYTLNYQIRYYGNDTYYKKFRNIQNLTLANSTTLTNLTLYNLLTASGYPFKITIVGNLLSSTGNSNLLVDIQKQYLPFNQFLSVEAPVTDTSGIATGYLIQNSEVYTFIISYNGHILGIFNNYRVQCDNTGINQCNIILNLGQSTASRPDFENYGGISLVYLYQNSTKIVYETFTATDSQSHTVQSLVLRTDNYGNTTICNNTATGTSGTMMCQLPSIYQDTNFYIQTISDGELIATKFFGQGATPEWYGADIFIILLMFSSIVMLCLANPVMIIIGSILGLISPILLIWVTGASLVAILGSIAFYIGAGVVLLLILKNKT